MVGIWCLRQKRAIFFVSLKVSEGARRGYVIEKSWKMTEKGPFLAK
jgi:hypothetical protein